MRTRVHTLFVAVATLAASVACRQGRPMPAMPYYEFKPVDAHAWRCTDTLRFRPDTATLPRKAALSLSLRLGQQFAYRDLWLVCEQRSDTLHFILANARGRWQTTGVVLHEASLHVRNVSLRNSESPEFLVYHIMREQQIQGVFDVGLKIE